MWENLGAPKRAVGPRKTCGEGAWELGPVLRTFAPKKRDKLSGLEFAGFSGQKTRRTFGAGFRRKTSELGGPGSTFDACREKTHFSELAVLSAFCTKNGAVTKR